MVFVGFTDTEFRSRQIVWAREIEKLTGVEFSLSRGEESLARFDLGGGGDEKWCRSEMVEHEHHHSTHKKKKRVILNPFSKPYLFSIFIIFSNFH